MLHSSLLQTHKPNYYRLFPGRLASQVAELEDQENEWAIDKFLSQKGSGPNVLFEAVWKSRDHTWVPYSTIKHLGAFTKYLHTLGVSSIKDLPEGTRRPPTDDPQIFLGNLEFS